MFVFVVGREPCIGEALDSLEALYFGERSDVVHAVIERAVVSSTFMNIWRSSHRASEHILPFERMFFFVGRGVLSTAHFAERELSSSTHSGRRGVSNSSRLSRSLPVFFFSCSLVRERGRENGFSIDRKKQLDHFLWFAISNLYDYFCRN